MTMTPLHNTKLTAVQLRQFSAFENAELAFSPGINVFVGANATGKTHLLKVLYTACSVMPETTKIHFKGTENYGGRLATKLRNVFKPDLGNLLRLIRRGAGEARLAVKWNSSQLEFKLGPESLDMAVIQKPNFKDALRALFIPSREVLSMFRGFTAVYEEQELPFDETYYDICKALTRNLMKGMMEERVKLVAELRRCLGGDVVFSGTDFYVKGPDDQGKGTEAQLVSEGMRKIAMLAHLLNNGAINRFGILFWDEPESSMNPKFIKMMADVLRGLAAMGLQVFIATHDYLLVRELSLAGEYKLKPAVQTRFFCFARESLSTPVTVESGELLADLKHNPILEEFAAHYDREQKLFYREVEGK